MDSAGIELSSKGVLLGRSQLEIRTESFRLSLAPGGRKDMCSKLPFKSFLTSSRARQPMKL